MFFSAFVFLSALLFQATMVHGAIDPGMTGWGLTVFQGEKPDTFGVEIVEVLPGQAPGEGRILVRLTGGLVESTGVASGMSGSPVYVNDELIGALAAGFPFVEEPMGLVTPIDAMLNWVTGSEVGIVGWNGKSPLSGVGFGFDSHALSSVSVGLKELGITFQNSGGGQAQKEAGDLEPGEPAAIIFVEGDWNLAAIGTVTWKDGTKIAAFGHPLMGLGMVDLPLAGARIAATLPSLAQSFKVGSPGRIRGRIVFDGTSGVIGILDEAPRLLPLSVHVKGPVERTFDLRLAVHPAISPILLRACIQNCAGVVGGPAIDNAGILFEMYLEGGQRRSVESVTRGAGALTSSGEELSMLLAGVMNCPLGEVTPESLSATISLEQRTEEYFLKNVMVRKRSHPFTDKEIAVAVTLLSSSGETVDRTIVLGLPPGTRNEKLSIFVADGPAMLQWERARAPLTHTPSSVEEYLDELFHSWAPNRLYFALVSDSKGWSRRGGEVSRLPRSYTGVLSHAQQRGFHDLSKTSVLSRTEIVLDGMVHGSAALDLFSGHEQK